MQPSGALSCFALTLLAGIFSTVAGTEVSNNPLEKVLELLTELSAKVTKEGEAEAAAYKEFFEWCDDASRDTQNAITTSTAQKGKLEAKISALGSDVESSMSKIESLAGATSASGTELKEASEIRAKEEKDHLAGEKELLNVIDALERALAILEREMQKGSTSFAQVDASATENLMQSLSAIVEAAGISSVDRQKLLLLVQSQEDEQGAPAAAVYKSHSINIFDLLEDLKAKAESQLSDLRKAEADAKHNFEMLKKSLEAQAAADSKDLEEEKSSKAEAEEAKAAAEGELKLAVKELANAEESLKATHVSCMQTAADHEAAVNAREEELKVIAEAVEVLEKTSPGAVEQTYSMLQLTSGSRVGLAGFKVAARVQRLAREHHSAALAQLASRITATLKYGSANGEDPFSKVKGLIRGLIETLEAEAQSEADEKAFCDEEMAKSAARKEELDEDISKLTVKMDQATAKSASLKEEVKELQLELAALAKLQAEMDKIRQETHGEYVQAKADLEQGVNGVRKALGILREYYAADEESSASLLQEGSKTRRFMRQPEMPQLHVKATGAGTGIIGILEVVESDFATNLAKEETEEEDAQTEYEKLTQENKISKTLKEKDVEHTTQTIKQLGKTLTELSADREPASTELAAVMEYLGKLKERCVAKPETYEKRKERREAEIAGLKEALSILKSEAALVQRKRRGHIRGALTPAQ
mmetsp:Transcript_35059/g.81389  ORF Transcript_35059/g.81389 Transcript_35059/m.81389 type:complete len:707 (-) Transcript_35059:70-2190(-)